MKNWEKRDNSRVWHPYTTLPLQSHQALLTGAQGAYVYDEQNRKLFDSHSSWWCQIHGHCHPRLTDAIRRQAEKLDQVLFAPHTHRPGIELAESLVERLGPPLERVFYSDDGSTAVEAALKMALQYWSLMGSPERSRFLSIKEGYHGDTLGAVGVGYVSEFHRPLGSVVRPSFVSTQPYCYRCPEDKNYPSCELACLDHTESLLKQDGEKIAALIVEPLIMGAAGHIVYPKPYLEKLIRLCRQYDILIIFDEVFTGFGRTGSLFVTSEWDEKPDMVCLSKGITSGTIPLGVTAVTGQVFEPFMGGAERTFFHGHTYTANPLACAVALESLKIFDEEGVLQRNLPLIELMGSQKGRFEALPVVGEVRHVGMIWAAELVKDKGSKSIWKQPNGPGWSLSEALWKENIWMRPLHNMVYTVPPYCTTLAELERFFDVLFEALGDPSHFEESRHGSQASD